MTIYSLFQKNLTSYPVFAKARDKPRLSYHGPAGPVKENFSGSSQFQEQCHWAAGPMRFVNKAC
jgi:hypothetical protein